MEKTKKVTVKKAEEPESKIPESKEPGWSNVKPGSEQTRPASVSKTAAERINSPKE